MRQYSRLPINLFLFLCLSIVWFSCQKSESPCSGPQSNNDINLGKVKLNSSFRIWINPVVNSVTFKNSNGGTFVFLVSKSLGEKEQYYLTSGPESSTCGGLIQKYCDVEYDYVSYKSSDVPFDFNIYREIPLDYGRFLQYKDSSQQAERLSFAIGINSFGFWVSDTISSFSDSYRLLDSVYNKVCVCNNSDIKKGLYPTKFILQKGRGLIGFELSNKEVWAIQ